MECPTWISQNSNVSICHLCYIRNYIFSINCIAVVIFSFKKIPFSAYFVLKENIKYSNKTLCFLN